MDRAEPRAGEHREQRLGDHRQIDQHDVAALRAQRTHDRGHAVDFGVQLGVSVLALDAGFGRYVDQRVLLCALGQMAVDRVMTEVRAAADEPAREWRLRAVEHSAEWRVPVNTLGFFAPEGFGVFDRAAVEIAVAGHRRRSSCGGSGRGYETAVQFARPARRGLSAQA
ncbi:hypothetical protein OKW48_003961 [Paraburkholderia youngii]